MKLKASLSVVDALVTSAADIENPCRLLAGQCIVACLIWDAGLCHGCALKELVL